MSIDYEKSFKKLVEQIRLELQWSNEELEKNPSDFDKVRKARGLNRALMDVEAQDAIKKNRYFAGMKSAYNSIEELAEKLEKGEFEFDE